ncbi:hypothetical protein CH252_05045 [Rhodococcus sp. 06-1477-1B]|nr:hypothetical protein CH252_05045 [Rhodococcus sp. 06-1477-1B]
MNAAQRSARLRDSSKRSTHAEDGKNLIRLNGTTSYRRMSGMRSGLVWPGALTKRSSECKRTSDERNNARRGIQHFSPRLTVFADERCQSVVTYPSKWTLRAF